MGYYELSHEEQKKRRILAERARRMIQSQILVEGQDETSLAADYRGFYLQISFSALHPLILFCFIRALERPGSRKQDQQLNELNLGSIIGSHAVNHEAGCYAYRATHWLDMELRPDRFFEILDRCVDEAERGYQKLNESGYIPRPLGRTTNTERSEVGANTPLLQSRRQMPNGI